MEDEKKNFYFLGKWFDTFKEMLAYTCEWNDFPLDEETAERILDRLKKDILMNVFLCGPKMTNREFSNYIEEVFQFSMIRLRGKGE